MSASFFLVDTFFNLYLMVVILRLWLQFVRADFYNPFSQWAHLIVRHLYLPY
jgi:YggT family protein